MDNDQRNIGQGVEQGPDQGRRFELEADPADRVRQRQRAAADQVGQGGGEGPLVDHAALPGDRTEPPGPALECATVFGQQHLRPVLRSVQPMFVHGSPGALGQFDEAGFADEDFAVDRLAPELARRVVGDHDAVVHQNTDGKNQRK